MSNPHQMDAMVPFPELTSVFPGVLGQIANNIAANGIDPAIVALQLVPFASLLTQGTVDISWPNGQSIAIGGNSLLVAPSGSGKSVVFKMLMAPIARVLSELVLDGDMQLSPALFVEDVTREALVEHFRGWKVAALLTDEAGQLKPLLSKSAPTLAKLLDGTPLLHARVSTGRVALIGHRMTMLLMEQPQVFEASKALLGTGAGGVGLINRFFVGIGGGLPTGSALHRLALSESASQRYMRTTEQLIKRTVAQTISNADRPILQLSREAAEYVPHIADNIRKRLDADAGLATMAEYATRHPERTLRLAGVLHAFEHGADGVVDIATVRAAEKLGFWSLDAFLQLTYEPPRMTQAERDALTLEHALRQTVNLSGVAMLRLSEVRRAVPNVGITKARFDRALPVLAGNGSVSVVPIGRVDWLHVHPLNPNFLT